MTKIFYNGVDPFSGISPTPLFSRTETPVRFGPRWALKQNIKLKGEITGKCITYQQFLDKQTALLAGFSKDFQTLDIRESGSSVLSFDSVKITSIDFDASTYANGMVPFTISLESYPQNYFSGVYGVLNPKESFAFGEEPDGQIKLTHTTSAQGFCISGGADALDRARSWVSARTGWSSQILPAFISGAGNGMCLKTLSENYDRLNATYEVSETYIGDQFGDATQGLLRYTTDYSSGIQDGISTMIVQGEIKGCRYQSLSGLRQRYSGFNAFNEAVNQFQRISNRTDLNSTPVSKGVTEDVDYKIITFSYTFDDDLRPVVNIAYQIQFEYDYENDVVTASISATVGSSAAYSTTKWASVLAVADQIDLYSLVIAPYNAYVAEVAPNLAAFPLNKRPVSYSRTDNQYGTTVSLSATFSNPAVPPNGLDTFSSTIAITPALHKYAASPILDGLGNYYVFDLGFVTRGSIQISAQGQGNDATSPGQTLAILKTKVQALNADNFAGARMVLDSQSYVTGSSSFGKQQSVSASWSAESTEFKIP